MRNPAGIEHGSALGTDAVPVFSENEIRFVASDNQFARKTPSAL
jgi:hypothetical protein